MSFNAKNLSYESNEPAFLRRLRGEHRDRDSSRHERPLARPRKQVQEGEEDDQPTYVVEDSQDTLSKAEYEALVAADKEDENDVPSSTKFSPNIEEAEPKKEEVTREAALVKQQVAGIGASTKRRLAKVIGDEGEGEAEAAPEKSDCGKNSKKSTVKKGKKMKLSFDEEVSGEAPQVPVASAKSGNVFEKRLIEAYISEHGKDPVTNEDLTTDDLVVLKSSRTVRPRPPTLTSIPSLLSVFQNEWDALALETHTLRQHLTQTRQELSRALYEHDAAVRVITRLSGERDEAREALSRIAVNGVPASNGDSMQIDMQELPGHLVAKVEATQETLSKTRRKRAIPEDWATPDLISNFTPTQKSKSLCTGARTISLDASGDLALLGGSDGTAGVFSISQNKLVQELPTGSPVTDTLWAGSKAIVGTSSGIVKSFENGVEVSSFSGHAGAVTALALHPSGDILASVGVDKSYIFYDLTSSVQTLQVSTDSALTTAQFHPDGHLFAAGGADGQIKLYEMKTGANAANFDAKGPLKAVEFSENGIWVAAAVEGSTSVSIWDLRKASQIKVLENGGHVTSVRWDYTGQYLATAGPTGVAIQHYSKSSKEWSEPLRSAVPAVSVDWGSSAQKLVALDGEGVITVLGSA